MQGDLIDDARCVDRREQRRVVIELMPAIAIAVDAVREQQSSRIARVAPALADTRRVRDHRGAK